MAIRTAGEVTVMWKRQSAALVIVAAIAILAVVPFRTHAVNISVTGKDVSAKLSIFSPREMLESAYLTRSTVIMIIAILAATIFLAVRIMRAR